MGLCTFKIEARLAEPVTTGGAGMGVFNFGGGARTKDFFIGGGGGSADPTPFASVTALGATLTLLGGRGATGEGTIS